MENATRQRWTMGPIMPHEKLMDKNGLNFNDLSEAIQEDVRNFDLQHAKALTDGDISEEEHKALLVQSYEIVKKILTEQVGNDSNKKRGGGGILFGLLLGIGATLGIGKLLKP